VILPAGGYHKQLRINLRALLLQLAVNWLLLFRLKEADANIPWEVTLRGGDQRLTVRSTNDTSVVPSMRKVG